MLFKHDVRELFPGLHAKVEEWLAIASKKLYEASLDDKRPEGAKKRELLLGFASGTPAQGGPYPFTRLLGIHVGQPDQGETSQAIGQMNLYGHFRGGQPVRARRLRTNARDMDQSFGQKWRIVVSERRMESPP